MQSTRSRAFYLRRSQVTGTIGPIRLIAPMLATAGTLPDTTAERPWSFEMKYDGCRILASVDGGHEPVLWTRNLNVVTPSCPEIADALTTAFGGRGRIVLRRTPFWITASPDSD